MPTPDLVVSISKILDIEDDLERYKEALMCIQASPQVPTHIREFIHEVFELPMHHIFEHGTYCTSCRNWQATVRGMNTAMDVVDGAYSQITVHEAETGEIVYEQERHHP